MSKEIKMFEGSIALTAEWYKTSVELKELKAKEAKLRKEIAAFFIDPKEGTNSLDLGDGHLIKLTHKMTRSLDTAQLDSLTGDLEGAGVPLDMLVERKPTLVKSVYNKLSPEMLNLFDQVVTVKPATPAIEIVKKKD